jgi:hypothetical protein
MFSMNLSSLRDTLVAALGATVVSAMIVAATVLPSQVALAQHFHL